MNRLEVDQAVFFSLVGRGWQVLSGPITIALLAAYFTPAMRGYFSTFGDLLAMQLFFELSLHVVLINLSSHEWAGLKLTDRRGISGHPDNLSRLVHLGRSSLLWYGIAAILFAGTVTIGGIRFLSQGSLPASEWVVPWALLVVLTSLLLVALPFTAILEGCGQLPTVNRFRVLQAVTGSLVVWSCIASNLGLWAAVGSAAVRLFWEFWMIAVYYREFFRPFRRRPTGATFDWSGEVWPLQWRLAVQGVFFYFSSRIFGLVIFQYHGDAAGGRMGLTWNILTIIQASAFSWVETRRPLFGQLIAKRDFAQLDRVFRRLSIISIVILALALTGFCTVLAGVNVMAHPFATKVAGTLLDVRTALLLAVAILVTHIPRCLNIYVRAHKRDPFLIPGIIVNCCTGLAVWELGKRSGPGGAAIGYLVVAATIQFPCSVIIWWRCRNAWR